jgi:hypothetical protein
MRKTPAQGKASVTDDCIIGNAVLWKRGVFDLIGTEKISLANELMNLPRKQSAAFAEYGYQQVVICANLRHKASGKVFMVCSVHLTSQRYEYMRVLQSFLALRRLQTVRECLLKDGAHAKAGVEFLFCGDFNTKPGDPCHRFLRTGEGAISGCPFDVQDKDLVHTFHLRSAYEEALGHEIVCIVCCIPPLCEWVAALISCVTCGQNFTCAGGRTYDYIWYSESGGALRPSAVMDAPQNQRVWSMDAPSDHLPLYCRFAVLQ